MRIKEVIAVLNQMQTDGIIDRYAIGGAVGATFYLEPVATLDVDVFISCSLEPGQLIVKLQRVFDYLKARGHGLEGDAVLIAGWPVQFLPPTGPLVEEALNEAAAMDIEGTPVRVMTAEHLAAIALQTGRAKDKARLVQFVEAGALDARRFEAVLARHGLLDRWRGFERQFLSGPS